MTAAAQEFLPANLVENYGFPQAAGRPQAFLVRTATVARMVSDHRTTTTPWTPSKFAALVYGTFTSAEFVDEAGKDHPGFINARILHTIRNNVQAVLLEQREFIIAAWRGTASTHVWLQNMTLWSVRSRGEDQVLWCHKGFWDRLKSAWTGRSGMKQSLHELTQHSGRKIFFTGHSLGGACATISALRVIVEVVGLSKIDQVVPFSQRQTFDSKGAAFVTGALYKSFVRYVNAGDSVAETWMGTLDGTVLCHVGRKVLYTREPATYINPSKRIGRKNTMMAHANARVISEHEIKTYERNLAMHASPLSTTESRSAI